MPIKLWEALLQKINQYYQGLILLALPIEESELPEYTFYDQIDGFYLQFQPAADISPSYDQQTVENTLNDFVVNLQRSSDDKQFFAGLNAPALSADDFTCPSADCLISPRASAYAAYPVDLAAQLDFYRTYLSALSQRSWVQGISSRGFFQSSNYTIFPRLFMANLLCNCYRTAQLMLNKYLGRNKWNANV